MERVCIGIDPGLSGALCRLWRGELDVWDTPTVRLTGRGGQEKQEYDVLAMHGLLLRIAEEAQDAGIREVHAVLELPQFRPGLSSVAVGRIGIGWGLWRMGIAAAGMRFHVVSAAAWKRDVFRGSGLLPPSAGASAQRAKAAKENSRELARRLWPERAELFARVKDHDRAEAALLAWWLRRELSGH